MDVVGSFARYLDVVVVTGDFIELTFDPRLPGFSALLSPGTKDGTATMTSDSV